MKHAENERNMSANRKIYLLFSFIEMDENQLFLTTQRSCRVYLIYTAIALKMKQVHNSEDAIKNYCLHYILMNSLKNTISQGKS